MKTERAYLGNSQRNSSKENCYTVLWSALFTIQYTIVGFGDQIIFKITVDLLAHIISKCGMDKRRELWEEPLLTGACSPSTSSMPEK